MSYFVDRQCQIDDENLPSEAQLTEWVTSALKGRLDAAELSIRIVSPEESRELNHQYRGKDSATNVLSFPFEMPDGFNYILTNQVLDASDARNNDVTKPFSHSYFEPLNIYSLLDYIYILDSKPLGVICCESVGSKVTWSHVDKESLIKVADVTNLFLSKQIQAT